jgi:hypothetical protein
MKVLIIAAVFALVAAAASAQQLRIFGTRDRGYTVQTPGQLPTYVTPNPGGGYTFQTPGQLPMYATPNINGRVHPAATRPVTDVHTPAINRGSSFNRQAPRRIRKISEAG